MRFREGDDFLPKFCDGEVNDSLPKKKQKEPKSDAIEIEEAVHLRKYTPHPSDFEIEELVCWSSSQSSRILRESGNIAIVGNAESSQNERV